MRTIDLDGKRIKLQIWDTAGQERYTAVTTAFYRGAMGILLVYDVTDGRTFNNIRKWHRTIRENASEGVSKILIGNKTDEQARRAVTEEQGRELADELGMQFMETSAKASEGVTESFYALARDILPRIAAVKNEGENSTTDDSVRIAQPASQERSGICC